MGPLLSEAEVAAAERQYAVSFPPEYRSFLREVGHGGMGVYPLRHDTAGWHWLDDDHRRTTPAHLAQPFRSPEERDRMEQDYEDRMPQRDSFPDKDTFLSAWTAWNEECDPLYAQLESGTVQISDEGCGNFLRLAVTGPERGTMWWQTGTVLDPLQPHPAPSPTSRTTFRQWYLNRWTRVAARTQ